ncbi:uncharacterized protein AB675_8732 [Cyphellophora attinorum]|uniref:MYND-type domain-containing protein n=1 Tax=Cyphellophora attinorum TaxID=1664694 RepID=A0A0N1HFT3_9EURO|nr:uncharacterized protein AB675_8732 [Phialophora attinorum]KPI44747.1 hypothetical protein AB675_8732 [Phialophora attinorum]
MPTRETIFSMDPPYLPNFNIADEEWPPWESEYDYSTMTPGRPPSVLNEPASNTGRSHRSAHNTTHRTTTYSTTVSYSSQQGALAVPENSLPHCCILSSPLGMDDEGNFSLEKAQSDLLWQLSPTAEGGNEFPFGAQGNVVPAVAEDIESEAFAKIDRLHTRVASRLLDEAREHRDICAAKLARAKAASTTICCWCGKSPQALGIQERHGKYVWINPTTKIWYCSENCLKAHLICHDRANSSASSSIPGTASNEPPSLCGDCKATWYCSVECLTLHWPEHKKSCAARLQGAAMGRTRVPDPTESTTPTVAPLKRGRGRPRKIRPDEHQPFTNSQNTTGASASSSAQNRVPLREIQGQAAIDPLEPSSAPPKRGPGRPRKTPIPSEVPSQTTTSLPASPLGSRRQGAREGESNWVEPGALIDSLLAQKKNLFQQIEQLTQARSSRQTLTPEEQGRVRRRAELQWRYFASLSDDRRIALLRQEIRMLRNSLRRLQVDTVGHQQGLGRLSNGGRDDNQLNVSAPSHGMTNSNRGTGAQVHNQVNLRANQNGFDHGNGGNGLQVLNQVNIRTNHDGPGKGNGSTNLRDLDQYMTNWNRGTGTQIPNQLQNDVAPYDEGDMYGD